MNLTPCYWNIISQTSLRTKKIYNIGIKIIWQYFLKGNLIQFFSKKEWESAGDKIANKLYKDKNFVGSLEKKLNQAEKQINVFLEKNKNLDYSKLTFSELTNTANAIKNLWLDYDNINIPSWYIGGDKFRELIFKDLNIPEDEFLFLTTPTKKTAVSELEYKLLKCTKLIKDKKRNLEKTAEKLSQDYGWIPFGYDGLEYWSKDYFIRELRKKLQHYSDKIDKKVQMIEKKDKENLKIKQEIIKKYKLSEKQIDLIKKINLFAVWTDERKKLEFKLHYYYSKILLELEKRYNIPYINLKYLFTEELSEVSQGRDRILRITNKRINKDFMVEFRNGQGGIIPARRKNKILRELSEQTKPSEIKGTVACRGNKNFYQGRVKVLFSPREGDKVKKGDFLIATMTTPDYIVSMKKAAGFITDEGGVTCHAAIVAREMNKPCIIGTKIATKVLKDGDLVEVDAERGVVKILKRKNERDKNKFKQNNKARD